MLQCEIYLAMRQEMTNHRFLSERFRLAQALTSSERR